MALSVNEIFYSIQGESTYAGSPCVFVRLAGCNLRCAYCDTLYARQNGRLMEIDEIVSIVEKHGVHLVEVTGGEPLIQVETPVLVERLLNRGYSVLLETNGSRDISALDKRCAIILDIKCLSSSMSDHNDLENISKLTKGDEVKFVIGDLADYEFAKDIVNRTGLERSMLYPILFSPVFQKLDPEILARWIIKDKLNVRLQLQIHKMLRLP
ncbi:MAG: radical SAM protein [Pseudomonadota bacterium]